MNKFYTISAAVLAGLVFCGSALACPLSKGSGDDTHGTATEETAS